MNPKEIATALRKRAELVRSMASALQRFGPHATPSADAVESELRAMADRLDGAEDTDESVRCAILGIE
jgi:hypothetical protein